MLGYNEAVPSKLENVTHCSSFQLCLTTILRPIVHIKKVLCWNGPKDVVICDLFVRQIDLSMAAFKTWRGSEKRVGEILQN